MTSGLLHRGFRSRFWPRTPSALRSGRKGDQHRRGKARHAEQIGGRHIDLLKLSFETTARRRLGGGGTRRKNAIFCTTDGRTHEGYPAVFLEARPVLARDPSFGTSNLACSNDHNSRLGASRDVCAVRPNLPVPYKRAPVDRRGRATERGAARRRPARKRRAACVPGRAYPKHGPTASQPRVSCFCRGIWL
jgi:hypothetical protein